MNNTLPAYMIGGDTVRIPCGDVVTYPPVAGRIVRNVKKVEYIDEKGRLVMYYRFE